MGKERVAVLWLPLCLLIMNDKPLVTDESEEEPPAKPIKKPAVQVAAKKAIAVVSAKQESEEDDEEDDEDDEDDEEDGESVLFWKVSSTVHQTISCEYPCILTAFKTAKFRKSMQVLNRVVLLAGSVTTELHHRHRGNEGRSLSPPRPMASWFAL